MFHCVLGYILKPGMGRNEARASFPRAAMSLRGGVTCTRADPIAEWILLLRTKYVVQLLLRVRTV